MLRDLTMIFSVLLSVVSLGFGVYKNIEAGNAKGFVYEQAYRIMGAVNKAEIGPAAKADIIQAALGTLGTPPPVIDLSRSSADAPIPAGACSDARKQICVDLAGQLADANAACLRGDVPGVCAQAAQLKNDIDDQRCLSCFIP